MAAPTAPIKDASATTVPSTWARDAPTARSRPSSRRRCKTEINSAVTTPSDATVATTNCCTCTSPNIRRSAPLM